MLANEAVAGKPAWFASKLAPTPERATGYTLLDFGQFFSESDERVQLHARIVTSPVYAKVLLEILRGSLAQCERRFGPIPWQNAPGGLA